MLAMNAEGALGNLIGSSAALAPVRTSVKIKVAIWTLRSVRVNSMMFPLFALCLERNRELVVENLCPDAALTSRHEGKDGAQVAAPLPESTGAAPRSQAAGCPSAARESRILLVSSHARRSSELVVNSLIRQT